MRFAIGTAAVAACFAVLAGCKSTATVETVVMTPAQVASAWKNANDHSDAAYCVGELWKLGTKQGFFPGDPVEVGYARGHDPGTEPFPCWEWSSGVARGFVQFDLAPFAGKVDQIIAATLHYDATYEWKAPGIATNEIQDIIASIHLVNAPWGSFDIAAEKIIDVPAWPGIKPGMTLHFAKPVSYSIVREWIKGARPNHGFLFVGRDESLPAKSGRLHLATVKNLKLELLVAVPK